MPARHPRCLPAVVLVLLVALAVAAPLAAVTPVGEPFRLDGGGTCDEHAPDLARLADGGFVAVWLQTAEEPGAGAVSAVHARLFDADGTPRGPAFLVDAGDALSFDLTPAVAAGADGGFLVAWLRAGGPLPGGEGSVLARPYTADGTPAGGVLGIGLAVGTGVTGPVVDAAPAGDGYRVVWLSTPQPQVASRRLDAAGNAGGTEVLVAPILVPPNALAFHGLRVASDPGGFTLVTGAERVGPLGPGGRFLLGWRFPAGSPVEAALPLPLPDTGGFQHASPAVGTDTAGNSVVVWREERTEDVEGLNAQRFAPDGSALGPPRWIAGPGGWTALSDPVVAVAGDGAFQVSWAGRRPGATEQALFAASFAADGRSRSAEQRAAGLIELSEGAPDLLPLGGGELLLAWSELVPTPGVPGGPSCPSPGILAQRLATAPREELRLHDGRFAVRVDWRDPYSGEERTGSGVAEPLTDEAGWFWFFRPGNAELVVKVLDGRPVNGHWWVFRAGLSSVESTLEVTDTVSGERWSHRNPPTVVDSGADTLALPAGPGASAAAVPQRGPAAATASHLVPSPCADVPAVGIPPETSGFCLHGRFEVTVEWSLPDEPEGRQARGQWLSADSGYLWFFRRDNAEVFVKILDARPIDGHWWLFAGSLTSLPYTLTVHDVFTGIQRTWVNPPGAFDSLVDTRSFRDGG